MPEGRAAASRGPVFTRRRLLGGAVALAAGAAGAELALRDPRARRPSLVATDGGVVLRHGDGPGRCDVYGARDPVVLRAGDGGWYMTYDGAGDEGWTVCLATSPDGLRWTKRGSVLGLGAGDRPDSASAAYGVPVQAGPAWHLFYLGTRRATGPPDRTPVPPYVALKAEGPGPGGPWTKRYDVVPFSPVPGTYYADTAAPGAVVRMGDEWWQYFSAAAGDPLQRTLGIARTQDLTAPWTVGPQPILPPSVQVENSALYREPTTGTWFLFTNHVGPGGYTDRILAFWSDDPARWDPVNARTVFDGTVCRWSKRVVGLPSVVALDDRIAVYYDGAAGQSTRHTGRDVGVAFLPRPLLAPDVQTASARA